MGEYIGIGVSAYSMYYNEQGFRVRYGKNKNLLEIFKQLFKYRWLPNC